MEKTNEPVTMEITLDEKQKKIEDTKENRAKLLEKLTETFKVMDEFTEVKEKTFWTKIDVIKPPLAGILDEIAALKVTISESFKENKKINTRQSTLEKKKPSTPVHKTNLKLKKENNVMNYSTNNAKKSTSGKSMDVIHDMKMGLKKATTDRKDINLKTIKIEEEDIKKRREKEKLKKKKMKKEEKEEKALREKAIKDKALKDKIMKERLSKEKKEKGNKKSLKEASPNKEKQSKKVFTNVTVKHEVKKTEKKKEDAKIENVKQVQVELDLQSNEEKEDAK